MKRLNLKGITLVELIVVIGLMAVLAFALYPLISTTYESWRIVDRRVELLQQGRVGMSKLSEEIRKSYDIYFSTAPTYLDIYPDWSTSTVFRFNFNSTATSKFLEFGTQAPFVNDTLAGPLTSFEYLSYDRMMGTGVDYRSANAFRFKFSVSDERHIAPPSLAPMNFHTFMNLRTSREGYYIGRTNAFATDTFLFDRSDLVDNQNQMCFKAFCDRTRPDVATASVRISCAIKFLCCPPPCKVGVWSWDFWMNAQTDARGGVDYYYRCLTKAESDAITTNAAWPPHVAQVSIWNDPVPVAGNVPPNPPSDEACIFYDSVKIVP